MAFVSEVSLIKFQPALTYTACSHGTVFYIKQSHIVPATATEVQYGQNCYIIRPSAGPTYIGLKSSFQGLAGSSGWGPIYNQLAAYI